MISEEESFFSDASQSDVGSIFSDGGSSCDEDLFGPNDDPSMANPCFVPPSPILPSVNTSLTTMIAQLVESKAPENIPQPKPRTRDADSCSTVDEFYSLEPSELNGAIAEPSTEEIGETSVVKPRSKSLNDSISPNDGSKSPEFRTTRTKLALTHFNHLFAIKVGLI